MKPRTIAYIYLFFLILFIVPIYITPFIHDSSFTQLSYSFYHLTCHQILERSFCYFPDKPSIEDCTIDSSAGSLDRSTITYKEGYIGYKFPVCSRDITLYTGALISAILFLFLRKGKESEILKLRWFLLAIAPLAIDGIGQLLGFWHSNNLVRALTGLIAGLAFSFYAIPLLVVLFSGKKIKKD